MDCQILDITQDVKWIGVLDPDLIAFDIVMETRHGTTYNAYFVNAEKKAIVETVKEKYSAAFLQKISRLTNFADIAYIVCNHTEPDHSGSIKHLLAVAPQATVVGSGQAIKYLQEMTGLTFKSLAVKDGDVLDLGNKQMRFIGAPNLHWPDSMFSYLVEDRLLFTCDCFGAHFSHPAMFDDQVGDYRHAFKYYFDVILKPFSRFMLKAIEKIEGLDINAICPGHGPILRSTWKEKVADSSTFSTKYLAAIENSRQNILITYVSAYGYTNLMADIIAQGIRSKLSDVNVELVDIENIMPGELEEKIINSTALLVGSPTINQNTLLPVYRLFALLNPIRDRGKLASAFGSYGWSGEAISIIASNLKALKLNVMDGINARFFPHGDNAAALLDFGVRFAEELKGMKTE